MRNPKKPALDLAIITARELATATELLADLVSDLEAYIGPKHEADHARAQWVADRVRAEAKVLFEDVLMEAALSTPTPANSP